MEPLAAHEVDRYLTRLGVDRPNAPTVDDLSTLQLAHLHRVPFENLDIHLGRPIELGVDRAYDKVVEHERGGYCYELNILFGALLRSLGFGVDAVSARVAGDDGAFGPEFDHLALVVDATDSEAELLVDVGFGDAFDAPIPLVDGHRQRQPGKAAGVDGDGDAWIYREDRGDGWKPGYRFDRAPRRLDEFAAMNTWQQTSPDSHFTQHAVCSIRTAAGRTTLSDRRLITSVDGERSEREIADDAICDVLRQHFDVVLDADLVIPKRE